MSNLNNLIGQGAISDAEANKHNKLSFALADILAKAKTSTAGQGVISDAEGQGVISDAEVNKVNKAKRQKSSGSQGVMTRDELIKQGIMTEADSSK